MAENDPAVKVEDDGLSVKFYQTIKALSVTNANFKIFLDQATPTEVVGALKTIKISEDYNSISRTIKLYFAIALTPNTNYFVRISGIKDSSGASIPSVDYDFTIASTIPDYGDLVPAEEPVLVEDRSIIEVFDGDMDEIIEAYNPDFYLSSWDPDDPFIEADNADGRITLTFSSAPMSSFLNSTFFRLQRKEVSRDLTRWTSLTTQISASGNLVYIDSPSVEATPVYHTAGKDYFEEGYKYRLKISKDVGISTDATPATAEETLGEDKFLYWMVGLDPLFADYEELQIIFPDADPVEITELIYIYSIEAQELAGVTEPTPLMREYVRAAVACALTRVYEMGGLGDEGTFTLGDLTITKKASTSKGVVNKYTANSWCELAGVLRDELLRSSGASGLKAYVRGANVVCPMPSRRLRSQEWRRWGIEYD